MSIASRISFYSQDFPPIESELLATIEHFPGLATFELKKLLPYGDSTITGRLSKLTEENHILIRGRIINPVSKMPNSKYFINKEGHVNRPSKKVRTDKAIDALMQLDSPLYDLRQVELLILDI